MKRRVGYLILICLALVLFAFLLFSRHDTLGNSFLEISNGSIKMGSVGSFGGSGVNWWMIGGGIAFVLAIVIGFLWFIVNSGRN